MSSPAKNLVPFDERVITGFHGTTKDRARSALAEQQVRPSLNRYDWLGHGIYFWEESYSRARQWAEQKYEHEACVLQARVRLSRCLDLMDTNWAQAVKGAYERVAASYAARNEPCPQNRNGHRVLDCLVMNELASRLNAETVRGAFLEGESVYPTSLFVGLSHVQVVARDPRVVSALEIREQ